MSACDNGHRDVVKLLLDRNAQVDIVSVDGMTALMFASSKGYLEIVNMLLDNGAQVNFQSFKKSRTALIEASENGHVNVVKLLIDKGAQVNVTVNEMSALSVACMRGQTDVVQLLLDKDADFNFRYQPKEGPVLTPLAIACAFGYIEIVELLLDKGADINDGGSNLLAACINEQIELIKLLLDKGADVNCYIENPYGGPSLLEVCKRGNVEVVKLLIDKGADVNFYSHGLTNLIAACNNGHTEVAKLLIDKGADVNTCSHGLTNLTEDNGCTALMISCQNGHIEVVKLLLYNGADVNFHLDNGWTALLFACQYRHIEMIKLLIDKGAEVNICSNDGWTPLIRATRNGYINVIKLLLSKGALVDFQGYCGVTALMVATKLGYKRMVKVLIEHGADVYVEGDEGMSALAFAAENSRDDIISLLLGSSSDSETESETEDDEYESDEYEESESEEPELEDDKSDSGASELSESNYEDSKDVSEKRLLAAIEMAIKDGGIINSVLLHGVFLGPPRSGKDSLMKRLIGEMPSDRSPSTGAAENVLYVKMEKSTTFPATIEDSKWTRLMYNEEALQIMKAVSSKNVNITQKDSSTDITQHDCETDLSIADEITSKSEHIKTTHEIEFLKKNSNLSQLASMSRSLEPTTVQEIISQSKHKTPMEIFKEAIRNKDIEGLKKCLANTQLLYLTNTGGQMEFQEVLPLLVSGPSIFFITFELHRSITDTFSVVYELSNGELSKSYQSSLSVMETILQTLSSISAMGTYVYKRLQRKAVPLRPKVFIIGTHKDLLDKRSAKANIESIDKHLQAVINSTSHYREGIIQFASESRMIFTVNNHDPNDSDFQRIRTAVEKVVETGDYRIRSPTRWMIYSLVMRQLQDPIKSYNECYEIAKDCGIRDKSEFDEVLHFIHTKMGLIRYFPCKELADFVIIDPQILFEKITELIIETFTFDNVGKHAMEVFKNKGIFSLNDFERINSRTSCQSLTPKLFAKLLEHLRIAAPLQQDGVIKYFIPCALAHADKKELASSTSVLPPLLVTFQCGYCPKGIFGTLITYLIANEMQSSFEWEIITERIYRDEVNFQVGPYDIITVKFLPTHLEITLMASNPDLPRQHCSEKEVCQEVHQSVEKGIIAVTSSINYINAQHSFTFYCTSESCRNNSHPAKLNRIKEKICSLSCDKQKSCFPLPSGYEKWQLYSTEVCNGLKKSHYPSLISQLNNCTAKWREIGTHLGFQQEELNIIEARPLLLNTAPKSWLSTLLSEWMEWAPGDSRGSTKYANLGDLKSAVSKAGFGVVASGLSLDQDID